MIDSLHQIHITHTLPTQIVILPTIGSFGLIFGERYAALGLTATDVALVTNVNAAVGMSMGLVNGGLLRRFGCRPIAVVAGLLMTTGICLTATANSMRAFLLCYGVVTGESAFISFS